MAQGIYRGLAPRVPERMCSSCHKQPRKPGQRYCKACHAGYMREWRKGAFSRFVKRWLGKLPRETRETGNAA